MKAMYSSHRTIGSLCDWDDLALGDPALEFAVLLCTKFEAVCAGTIVERRKLRRNQTGIC